MEQKPQWELIPGQANLAVINELMETQCGQV